MDTPEPTPATDPLTGRRRALTVAGVAARWGFPDEATFTLLYLERFGHFPQRTLDRAS